MKKLRIILCLVALTTSAFGQGQIVFRNGPSTLISFGPAGNIQVMLPQPTATYYFALLSAPVGATDRTQFVFSGLYATNMATAGRLEGGSFLGVAANSTWPAATTRSYFVAGWSHELGTTWNQAWLSGDFGAASSGFFGWSPIAQGRSGGPDPPSGLTITCTVALVRHDVHHWLHFAWTNSGTDGLGAEWPGCCRTHHLPASEVGPIQSGAETFSPGNIHLRGRSALTRRVRPPGPSAAASLTPAAASKRWCRSFQPAGGTPRT